MNTLELPTTHTKTPLPYIDLEDWECLNEEEKTFLHQARSGGMRYLATNREVCAWGAAYEGIFTMDVIGQKHTCDGYLVTLPRKIKTLPGTNPN